MDHYKVHGELISDRLIVIASHFRAQSTDLMNLNIIFDVRF
jgi:hypothetical protein